MAEPRYRQIADELRRQIETGELAAGARLPTELELRDQYEGASRNTVRDAVKLLVNQGLVHTRPGQGTFVADRITPFATTMSAAGDAGQGGGEGVAYLGEAQFHNRKPVASVPRVEIKAAGQLVGDQLELGADEQVVSRHQRLSIDGKPWSMQTSFYPMEFVEAGARRLVEAVDIVPGAVHYIKETLGFRQVGYRDTISARSPNEGEIAFFRLRESGAVIIETVRTAFDPAGKPIRCTTTVWPADRNLLVYNIGEVPAPTVPPAAPEGSCDAEVSVAAV